MPDRQLFSAQSLHSIIAVAFVLGLLSVGLNFYNFTRTNKITAGLLDVEAASIKANVKSEAALRERIDDLETRVEVLERKLAEARIQRGRPEPRPDPAAAQE